MFYFFIVKYLTEVTKHNAEVRHAIYCLVVLICKNHNFVFGQQALKLMVPLSTRHCTVVRNVELKAFVVEGHLLLSGLLNLLDIEAMILHSRIFSEIRDQILILNLLE
jgi:hypothetical protein